MRCLEVCCADINSVLAAKQGGADRIELCSGLECGGLTPSIGLIREAVRIMPGRVNVLIRPRGGDFLYSKDELDVIEADIRAAVELGASGIVFGALTKYGDLDTDVLRRMITVSRPASFTLHRAFDVARDPFVAIEQAATLGIDRILTSGCAPDALTGIPTIKKLVALSEGRITILAGAGINPENAARIAIESEVPEFHASCKSVVRSAMQFARPEVKMGSPDNEDCSYQSASPLTVSTLVKILHNI